MKEIDGKLLKALFKKATEGLMKHRDEINALNVFPVPDGDTGSNMLSTMMEGCKYLDRLDKESIGNVLKAMKDGTLMGARGNSGVILSQILRGFAEGAPKNAKVLTVPDFVKMLKKAREVAYSAVMKPVEGTMLTVIRFLDERSDEAMEFESFDLLFDWMVNVADEAVRISPTLLDKLREAGVVDAGAKGLYYLFQGMKTVLSGDLEANLEEIASVPAEELPEMAYEELTFQYCTEYIIRVKEGEASKHYVDVVDYLNLIGDSVVVVTQDDLLKIHVHTNNPGKVLEELLKKGELVKAKIDNMKLQHEHIVTEAKERKKIGIVAVSPGDGISKIMRSLGVDQIVRGGQTMNPSTYDIKKAIEKTNAYNIFVFPNNPNIILAAQQAAQDFDEINVIVIPTNTPQECLAALINYDPEANPEEIKEIFEETVKEVIPISITKAVRNSKIGKSKIKKGEYLIFANKDLMAHSFDIKKALDMVLKEVKVEDKEVISIFTGKNFPEEDLEKIKELIAENYDHLEMEVYEGGQPHYPFLISIE
ncbi:MAG: DAK2 domain-containing protein [Thermotogaceae bacterium]|nr:DAK2 domain-containing protein [Thermotogaceae bacterium]